MSTVVKRRRQIASFLSTFTGSSGELIVDTTNNRVQVHDGVTAGGFPAAQLGLFKNALAFFGVIDTSVSDDALKNIIQYAVGSGTYSATFNGLVGNLTPADGKFTTFLANGYAIFASVADGLTATGTTRADALAIAQQFNKITTANAGTGVVLPTAVIGRQITIFNDAASPIKIYASGSDTIDGVAGVTGVALTNSRRASFLPIAAGTMISMLLGGVSE